MNLYRAARPLLFRVAGSDPEDAHAWTLKRLERLSRWPRALSLLRRRYAPEGAARTVFGIRFPTPVGLAAGADKNGVALPAWPAFGFGFTEVGTVTRYAQPGNPRPRLFRLVDSQAIVNRMGFNNHGAEALAARLAATGPLPTPLGISLGKSKITPLDDAVADYVGSLKILYGYGDYFAVNVSSPNTPGLRELQDRAHLTELIAALRAEAQAQAGDGPAKPLLVKLAPDLTDEAIGDLLQVCTDHGVAGVIAVNTTVGRDGIAPTDAAAAAESGGLSGRPLTRRALDVVRFVCRETAGRLPVVGVGGILDVTDGLRMLDAGADLVQLYTGLVYRGPGLVRALNRAAAGLAAEDLEAVSNRMQPDGEGLRRHE